MWLRNYLEQWKKKKAFNKQLALLNIFSGYTYNRLACVEALKMLELNDGMKNYDPSKGMTKIIKARYKDVGIYVEMMIRVINYLKRKEHIPVHWDPDDEVEISVENFLMHDGYYTDVGYAVRQFTECGLSLCEHMAIADNATVGVDEHNKRMLTKMFNNIGVIAIAIASTNMN